MTIHKRSWKKSLSSAAVCLVVVFFVYYEAMALIPWYFARDLGRDHPELGRTPVQMPDINVATLNGKLWQSFGCTLELPWKEVKKDRIGKSFEVRTFEEGAGVIFFASDFDADAPRIILEKAGTERQKMEKVLGPENLASRFNFMRATMYTRPQDASLFASREHNVRTMVFLGMKETAFEGPIYEIHQGNLQGFQIGDPTQTPFKISLELFDERDRKYRLILSSEKSSPVRTTQPQINAIIQSFRCS
jgi:hypothetical protein